MCTVHFSQLAQAALVGAVTRASGSGGGPQADSPRATSLTALTHDPVFLPVLVVVSAVSLPLTFLFRHVALERF